MYKGVLFISFFAVVMIGTCGFVVAKNQIEPALGRSFFVTDLENHRIPVITLCPQCGQVHDVTKPCPPK